MKKQFFTFLMMIALVIVAGSAMAQTNVAPYANGTTEYTYTWSGLTPLATTHTFALRATAPVANVAVPTTDDPAIAADYTWGTKSVSGVTATAKITWKNSANGNDYFLVFIATNASCTNYRYVQISPTSPVDFSIIALGVSGNANGTDLNITTSTTDLTGTSDCPPNPEDRVGANYLESAEDDGTAYVFFKVNRNNGTTANEWTVTLNNSSSVSTAYSTNGTTWTATTTNSNVDVLYVRLEIDVPVGATATTVSSEITAGTETIAAGLTASDFISTNNGPKTFTVNPVPSMGTFN